MNIKKNIDYSQMFAGLNAAMECDMEQMALYAEIGRLVALRPEKGAAVAAAEYLDAAYPEQTGFSPRNVRRMRNFYLAYQNAPMCMALAMRLNWTQNVVILEQCEAEYRAWYLCAADQNNWTKSQLVAAIENDLHTSEPLDTPAETFDPKKTMKEQETRKDKGTVCVPQQTLQQSNGRGCDEGTGEGSGAGSGHPDRVSGHRHRGKREPSLSDRTIATQNSWDRLFRQACLPDPKQGMRAGQPADWPVRRKPSQYVSNLCRRICWENAPPLGHYRLIRRCGWLLVQGRLRGRMARCYETLPIAIQSNLAFKTKNVDILK